MAHGLVQLSEVLVNFIPLMYAKHHERVVDSLCLLMASLLVQSCWSSHAALKFRSRIRHAPEHM